MATTTNFGWTTPDDTDLVKDGAAAIRTLGSSIDTSLVDLNGGTTGQVLTKASDTDLDFSFTTPASLPITTEGDLVIGDASGDPVALAIGATGTVLTSDGDTASWVAPAAGGKVVQVVQGTKTTTSSTASGSIQNTGLEVAITPTSASNTVWLIASFDGETRNGSFSTENYSPFFLSRSTTELQKVVIGSYNFASTNSPRAYSPVSFSYIDSPSTTSATTYRIRYNTDGSNLVQINCAADQIGSIIAIEVSP